MQDYAALYTQSVDDVDTFWLNAAQHIAWDTPPQTALDRSDAPFYHWYPDGRLNTCFNAVDRHVLAGRGAQNAIIYDSPITGTQRPTRSAAANPPNTTECTAPSRAQPSIATTASGIIGI